MNNWAQNDFIITHILQDQLKVEDLKMEEMEEFVHISVDEDLSPPNQSTYVKSSASRKLSESPLAKRGMSLITAGKKKLLGGILI